METSQTFENIDQDLAMKFEHAREHAMTYSGAIRILHRIEKLKSNDGDEEKIKKLEAEIGDSTVTVHTISEYKLLIEKTDIDPQVILDNIAHENAHGNVAQSLGAENIEYSLMVCRGVGRYMYNAWVSTHHPEHWSPREKVINLIKIMCAPNAYGVTNSEEDDRAIATLQKKLAEISE